MAMLFIQHMKFERFLPNFLQPALLYPSSEFHSYTFSHLTSSLTQTEGIKMFKKSFKDGCLSPLPFFIFIAPNEKMKQVLKKTIEEAKAIISKVSFLNEAFLSFPFLPPSFPPSPSLSFLSLSLSFFPSSVS